jgi:hypothetical protein
LTHIRALDATPITRNESICRIRHTEGLSNYRLVGLRRSLVRYFFHCVTYLTLLVEFLSDIPERGRMASMVRK